jgi:transcriptional regulator with PAS, ATPase and Fis domain
VALVLKMTKFGARVQRLLAKLRLKSKKNLSVKKKIGENLVPSGFLALHVGEERKLYVIPNTCLSSKMFQALFNQFEEKIMVDDKEPIMLPCSSQMFEWILNLAKDEKAANEEIMEYSC